MYCAGFSLQIVLYTIPVSPDQALYFIFFIFVTYLLIYKKVIQRSVRMLIGLSII